MTFVPPGAMCPAMPGGVVSTPDRRVRQVVALLVLAHVVLAWTARAPGIMTGQDDAQYLILGQSIRQGGYYELFRVDRPVHALYPPAYPALLAVWGAVAGDRYDALVALSVALSAGSLLLLFGALRQVLSPTVAAAATGLVALNLDVVRWGAALASEALYVFLSVLALFLLAAPAPNRRRLLFAGLAAILAALTRPIGVTLVAAVAVVWMLERRWKAVLSLGVASLLTIGAWLVWTAMAPDQHHKQPLIAGSRLPGSLPC